jgi:hypothetical protein
MYDEKTPWPLDEPEPEAWGDDEEYMEEYPALEEEMDCQEDGERFEPTEEEMEYYRKLLRDDS